MEDKELLQQIEGEINLHVQKAESYPKADPIDMFHHVYATMPAHLQEQQNELKQALQKDVNES